MLLAFAGVYALTADLSQRAIREIGIRKAVGATTTAHLVPPLDVGRRRMTSFKS